MNKNQSKQDVNIDDFNHIIERETKHRKFSRLIEPSILLGSASVILTSHVPEAMQSSTACMALASITAFSVLSAYTLSTDKQIFKKGKVLVEQHGNQNNKDDFNDAQNLYKNGIQSTLKSGTIGLSSLLIGYAMHTNFAEIPYFSTAMAIAGGMTGMAIFTSVNKIKSARKNRLETIKGMVDTNDDINQENLSEISGNVRVRTPKGF